MNQQEMTTHKFQQQCQSDKDTNIKTIFSYNKYNKKIRRSRVRVKKNSTKRQKKTPLFRNGGLFNNRKKDYLLENSPQDI